MVVVPYDPDWPRQFQREAVVIHATLGELLLEIEHVGSTAVPGIDAKPTIDLIAYAPAFEDGLACVEPLGGLGYEAEGEYGTAGRHYFRRYHDGASTHHLRLYAQDPAHPRHEIVFHDILLAHPDAAREYVTLKYALAERHRRARDTYTEAKTTFISDVLRRASDSDR